MDGGPEEQISTEGIDESFGKEIFSGIQKFVKSALLRHDQFVVKSHTNWFVGAVATMVLALAVVALKSVTVEPMAWYKQRRLFWYEAMQANMAASARHEPRVTLLNIVGAPRAKNIPPTTSESSGKPVDRDFLMSCIRSVVAQHPLAIGVDIEFSLDDDGQPRTMDDAQFVSDCTTLSHTSGVPIYLGVFSNSYRSPEDWLPRGNLPASAARLRSLAMAAGLAVGSQELRAIEGEYEGLSNLPVSLMPVWTKFYDGRNGYEKLDSLAKRLSDSVPLARPARIRPLLGWLVETNPEDRPADELQVNQILVDYSLVNRFHVIHFNNNSMFDRSNWLKGNLVLLGNVFQEPDHGQVLVSGSDKFRLPGHDGIYSGIYIHASSTETMLGVPLKRWTLFGRIAMDVFMAIVCIIIANGLTVIIGWIKKHLRKLTTESSVPLADQGEHTHRFLDRDLLLQKLISVLVGTVICLMAVPWAGSIRLVWDDAPFVAVGLVLHPSLHKIWFLSAHRRLHHPRNNGKTEMQGNPPDSFGV